MHLGSPMRERQTADRQNPLPIPRRALRFSMKHATLHFLFGLCALATVPASAQERGTVANIAKAALEEYRDQYQQSPLCVSDEVTLWTCESKNRVFSLCSSPVVTRKSGYMQYRASKSGKVVLEYPSVKRPPLGSFTYNSFGNGNASVEFLNKGYRYSLVDPLRSYSMISVSGPMPSEKTTEIKCGGNQTLQLNYTMRLMYDSGLWVKD